MRNALGCSVEEIRELLSREFGLAIDEVSFLPVGESSWVYLAMAATKQLVIKIQDEPNLAAADIVAFLRERRFAWMPYAYLAGTGKIWTRFKGRWLAVQDCIDTQQRQTAMSTPDIDYLKQLGQLLRALHSVEPPALKTAGSPHEKIAPQFLSKAKRLVQTIETASQTNTAVDRIRAALRTNKESLFALFQRSTFLEQQLQDDYQPLVLTHGDVHFGNLLQSSDSRLYLIDWDWAGLGLREKDLMYFDDEQLDAISVGYGQDLLVRRVALDYCRTELIIRALWFWINKALKPESAEELTHAANFVCDLFDADTPLSSFLRRAVPL